MSPNGSPSGIESEAEPDGQHLHYHLPACCRRLQFFRDDRRLRHCFGKLKSQIPLANKAQVVPGRVVVVNAVLKTFDACAVEENLQKK
jgi:hypothetical protein